jgi:hypothetical protein
MALVLCLSPVLAVAEDEEPEAPQEEAATNDPATAKKWLQAAQQLVRKGDAAKRARKDDDAKTSYDNAITAFEKAVQAGDVNAYFELAVLEEKLGRLDRAATHFRALTKAEGARADLVRRAQARFDELTMKTGIVTINATPEGTAVSIEGTEVGRTPLPEPLILMPGTYSLTLAAEGHQPRELELVVEAGSESERTLELEPTKIVVEPVEPVVTPKPPPPPPPAPSKLPLYIGIGTAGGLALIATVTGISALGKHSTFEDENASPAERQDAKDSGKRLALVTDLCIAGAVVAGGFTVYWYFAKYRPGQRNARREQAAKANVLPWVKPDAGGLALAGSF